MANGSVRRTDSTRKVAHGAPQGSAQPRQPQSDLETCLENLAAMPRGDPARPAIESAVRRRWAEASPEQRQLLQKRHGAALDSMGGWPVPFSWGSGGANHRQVEQQLTNAATQIHLGLTGNQLAPYATAIRDALAGTSLETRMQFAQGHMERVFDRLGLGDLVGAATSRSRQTGWED